MMTVMRPDITVTEESLYDVIQETHVTGSLKMSPSGRLRRFRRFNIVILFVRDITLIV